MKKKSKVLSRVSHFRAGLLKRRSLYQLNFAFGTTAWKECLMVIFSLLKLEPIQDGKWISIFEKKIAELLGVNYVFSYSAGRAALYTILKAIGIREGDEVILPGFTCGVVPTAIIHAGAKPVYADISRDDYSCDPMRVREKITRQTKAIIAQHTYGVPCKMEALMEIAKQHNLIVIEDCAHTFGTEYNGQKLGAIGDAAFFSTDYTKFMSTFLGGIAVTNNPDIGERLKEEHTKIPFLAKRDILKIAFQFIVSNFLTNKHVYFLGRNILDMYWWTGLYFFMRQDYALDGNRPYPYPARMSNIQAKIGVSQLNKLPKNIEHRKRVSAIYESIFNIYEGREIERFPVLRYSIEVNNRDEWIRDLEPVVTIETWFDSCAQGCRTSLAEIGYVAGQCPVAEEVSKRIINLPTHMKVRPKDVQKIALKVNEKLLSGIVGRS